MGNATKSHIGLSIKIFVPKDSLIYNQYKS
jgi:hypothetical protein